MAEVQRLLIEAEGETYEVYVESKTAPTVAPGGIQDDEDDESYGDFRTDATVKMQQARQMIRGYAMYALSAFKDFRAAEIEEVRLKFGLKLGGKTGIPYITEGSAESNLEIEVKCKFPTKPAGGQSQP
ncbi:MAG: hypothetical protein KME26_07900 [Oscillatoria princeps RMCB-10]|jgi:hypothetical protein|nr:hypothetical protein [Oscillatoria princeps RMCB-10]